MTPEEYEQFKEAEKAHLRKLRELKKTHQQLQRKAKVTGAVTDMAEGMNQLFDEHGKMVEKLQRDSIESEARMEVTLDNVDMDDAVQEAQDAADLEADQTLRKARAQELIRQMKAAEGVPASSSPVTPEDPTSAESRSDATTREDSSSELPEKTIGRMKR
jgi:putative protein kinase ArgK-like GTPase of G3E family